MLTRRPAGLTPAVVSPRHGATGYGAPEAGCRVLDGSRDGRVRLRELASLELEPGGGKRHSVSRPVVVDAPDPEAGPDRDRRAGRLHRCDACRRRHHRVPPAAWL